MNASVRRIGELKQLCLARLRGYRDSAAHFLAEAFPERQVLIRALDRISVYRLGRRAQVGFAAFAIMTSGWAITVVVGLAFGGPSSRLREGTTVVALELEPATHPATVILDAAPSASDEDDLAAIVLDPLEDQATGDVAEQTAAWPSLDEQAAGEAVEEPVVEKRPAAGAGAIEAPPADTAQSCAHLAEQALRREGSGEAVLERLRTQLAAVSDRVFALATRGLGSPAPAEDTRHARGLEEEGEAAALAQMASLERHVDRLATGVSALRSAETELLREVQPQLAYFIATAERVIERAGMDLDDVFQERTKPRRAAEGGPFIAAVSGPLAAERAALQGDLAYWQALRALVKRMPLAAPLDRYAISSSYGTRRDPLNDRQAMHHGIDLIAAPSATVRAPAPGIVVFAGRNGGYGNMIEIDHGRSLRTRYAHLRTIKVKAGDKVEFEHKLGTVGNSGRSTGAHLHYEILIAGKPADPLNFIKAGQHVFQE